MAKPAQQRSRYLAPGDKLGKYEVIRQIAIGGMAELYLARTSGIEGFEKLIVLKRILPQYLANSSFVTMFLNEARIAATLHHTNIAQVYDIGVDDGDYFFAMEYVHGEDLDHISIASEEQGVPLSLDAALTLVSGLCAGLHYAHEKLNVDGKPLQIVHRDVSPSNVLVSYDGSVKLVDFGIARASSRPGATTQSGTLKGKIAYMSPEQCRARAQLDRRSDIYAVGTILYEVSTGRTPFTGETEYQILNQIVNDDVPSPKTVVPSYPDALEKIVLRALARDPDARYPTAIALQTDIEDFAHETRLRISPLVLARLMGTLFPARLEEWDHAKTQGAFFVEQHVVRTLIESGKTPDPEARAELAAVLAREATLQTHEFAGEDDTTMLSQQRIDNDDTAIGAPIGMSGSMPAAAPIGMSGSMPAAMPIGMSGSMPAVAPPEAEEHVLESAPEPRRETPYPVVSELMTAMPGSLVTSTTTRGAPVQRNMTGDVTELVRVPRSASVASRAPGNKTFTVIAGLVVIAGGLTGFFAFRGGSQPTAARSSAPVEIKAEPVAAPQEAADEPPSEAPTDEPKEVEAPSVEPQNVAPSKASVPQVAPKVSAPQVAPKAFASVEPKKAEPKKVEPKKAEPKKVEPKKVEPKKIEPKPEPKKADAKKKPEAPKEKSWDVNSPFMPVRSDKR